MNIRVTWNRSAVIMNSSQSTVPTNRTSSKGCMLVTDAPKSADFRVTKSGCVGADSPASRFLQFTDRGHWPTSSTAPEPEPTTMVPSAIRHSEVIPLLNSSTVAAMVVVAGPRFFGSTFGYLAKQPIRVGDVRWSRTLSDFLLKFKFYSKVKTFSRYTCDVT